ncbi:1,2-dihydroxy-3-keto-5-methylthiopentene dioxygenase-like [Daphnia pulex]|uniref:1,2-dihydroxy-3-keto-5-methylthiopentene dioxygenase-like n=1 Tax=Daphnia pulex TaxID=6669 RepID=UPI001EE0A469|nr:1,2-dihydroxy-3-keto-5-methylthiopentene dioxygenase-like [Daphnia pulex]XP_046462681.1 1,2-dihydroxy-3-keto-5-methylthiopentene dioxygenase-like [Daphnia pulex]
MVSAWYMDDSDEDQRLDHHKNPPQPVDMKDVVNLTGVLHWKLNVDTYEEDGMLDKIKKDRGYNYEDVIEISPEKLPNYEEKLKIFFSEHLHTDEEIRFVVAGSGFFDVRDAKNDSWIRIKVEAGDLLILPAGIYHRFTLDSSNYIKAKRFFVGEPVWTPYNRPADEMPARHEYLASVQSN